MARHTGAAWARGGLLAAVLGAAMMAGCGANGTAGGKLESDFRTLPIETRRYTGPLFWLHGDESRERLEMYLGKVAEGGNGTFTAESRPHNDWLGPNWYRDLDICLQAAKKNNLTMWIFDEKWWPSQGIGGKVPPRYAAKQMEATAVEVEGPKKFEGEGYAGERYIACVAGRVTDKGEVEGSTLTDLAPSIREGKLSWQVPEGRWKIMRFAHKQAPGLGQSGGRDLSVDGASKDCVDWFIQTVYQPHYDRFKQDFGKTIVGYFYDEPETRGDWGTEVPVVLAEHKVDWKKAYVAYKFQLAGEEQAAARYAYLDAKAEAWGRTLYGGMTQWCRAHGVRSIGHFMEHGNLYMHQDFCAGDMMRLQKYSDMGAIDAVFAQFIWGKRSTHDNPIWQTPKLGSSISHAYGKDDDLAMVEIYGARGQDITYPEMKWWLDHMQVSGINFIIPHSFNPRAPHDTDCPPYFYNGGYEPRWPLYRVFADYSTRLTMMLTGGRHVCPVALINPGQSAHVGRAVLSEQISEALQDALFDCDWMPYEVLTDDMKVAGRQLELRDERYRILMLPPVEVMPPEVLEKARDFFERGGVVVGHGFLPERSATLGRTSAEVAELRKAVWGENPQPGLTICRTSAAGGKSFLLPAKPTPEQLRQVFAEAGVHPTLEVINGQTDHWVHVLHRVKEGRDVFFIANQNLTGEARTLRLRLTAPGVPECWDPMRNEVTALAFTREGPSVLIDLTLEPLESQLIVFREQARKLPPRVAAPAGETLAVTQDKVRVEETRAPEAAGGAAKALRGCAWVWYPEGNPAGSAAPGTCGFRKTIELPADRAVRSARFTLTADNRFVLTVNGQKAGESGEWRTPVTLEVGQLLKAGKNMLAIAATNEDEKPNPAGLIGKLTVEFAAGEPLTVAIDGSWKAGKELPANWTAAGFDDAGWPAARVLGTLGMGPWGNFGSGQLTLSPVAQAETFVGHVDMPAAAGRRVYLVLEGVGPEEAARVTINGQYAGGVLGRPMRLDITERVKAGRNAVEVGPFAPKAVKVVLGG